MANEKATCIKLVAEVEKYELLYTYKLSEYSRKDLTEKAWTEIANKTKLTVSDCKEKWRNIRSTFIRSTNQHPSDSKTKKPYYLSEHLTFTLPYVKPVDKIPNRGNIPPNPEEETAPDTETADNIETEPGEHVSDEGPTDSSEQHQTSNSPVQSTATLVPRERRRKASSVEVDAAMIKFSKNKTNKADENILNKTEKQMNNFFLSLLPEFSDMNAQQIRSFKIKVLQLIDDIKTAPMSGPSRNSTGSSSRDNYSVYSPISSVSTPASINQTEPPHAMNYQSLPANQDQVMNYQTEPQHAMTYQSESLPGYQDQATNFSVSDDSFYQFHQIRENTV